MTRAPLRPSFLTQILMLGLAGALSAGLALRPVAVVDGDSVRLAGLGLVRLEGVDTPELDGKCAGEGVRARRAAGRLAELLGSGQVVVTWGGLRREKYGRPLVRISAGGRDVAETLIAEGLGRPYAGGERAGWCE